MDFFPSVRKCLPLVFFIFAIGSVISADLSSTTSDTGETLIGGGSILSSSTSDNEIIIVPAPDGKLSVDYERDMGFYSLEVKKDPDDYSVEINAFDRSLGFIPERLYLSGNELSPSFDLYSKDGENLSYVNVFAEGIDLEYEILSNSLKEKLIITDIEDYSPTLLSSSTVGIDFVLIYDEDELSPSLDGETEWDGEMVETTDDIILIRKKEPGRLYLKNRFFRILRPFASDSSGDKIDMDYRLYEEDGKTHLFIDFPADWLSKADYPVAIDPTISLDTSDGWYRFINNNDCSTDWSDCTLFDDSPAYPSSHVDFRIIGGCSNPSYGSAQKDIFEFDVTDLIDDYDEDLYYATLYFDGTCVDIEELDVNEDLGIWQVGNYTGSASCGVSDPFDNVIGDIVYSLYGEGSGWSCLDGERSVGITSRLQSVIDDDDTHIAFKLDMDTPNGQNDDPGIGNDPEYKIGKTSDDLYIEYQFECVNSPDCSDEEYCKDYSTDRCYPDYEDDGDNCEYADAVDSNDYACPNGVCEEDTFDGSGYYCSDGVQCVNDGELIDYGKWHCEGENWAKQCEEDGDWGSQVNCDYGCEGGDIGCATTTTTTSTTSTTTTTTTTTLASDISVNPSSLTHRRYV